MVFKKGTQRKYFKWDIHSTKQVSQKKGFSLVSQIKSLAGKTRLLTFSPEHEK